LLPIKLDNLAFKSTPFYTKAFIVTLIAFVGAALAVKRKYELVISYSRSPMLPASALASVVLLSAKPNK